MAQAKNTTPAQTAVTVGKHHAALAAAKRQKTRSIIVTVAVILVAALILVPLGMFANGSIYRTLTAASVKDVKYKVSDYNYYFTTAYLNMYSSIQSTYGDYASMIINPSEPLDKQQFSEDTTWADYFKTQAIDTMQSQAMLLKEAEAAGFTLSAEQQEELATLINSVDLAAANYGYSTQAYLTASYGGGMNKAVMERCLTRSYTAQCYGESVLEGLTYTQEQLQARYDEDPASYDTVNFHSFVIPVKEVENQDADAQKAAAKVVADDMISKVRDTATFGAYVRTLVSEDELEDYEDDTATLRSHVSLSSLSGLEYGAWLFQDGRKAGDTYVAETSDSYQVIMFVAREDTHYNVVTVRHILITPETAEDESKPSEAAWNAAKAEAESLLAEWKAGAATEESFGALADEHTSDTGSSGGLYEDIHHGQMVPAFDDWCFAKHNPGDTGIIRSNYGYHVMYFVSEGEEYWTSTLTTELRNEDYSAWQTEKLEQYPIRTNEAVLRLGRHS